MVYGPIHGHVMGFRVDIGKERTFNRESKLVSLDLINDHKSAQELHNYSVTSVLNRGHLNKVDQLDYRKITVHSEKVSC